MKACDAITRADELKPNEFSLERKLEWLGTLEGRLMADVYLMGPAAMAEREFVFPDSLERKLSAPWPHDGMYVQWLMAKIDEANGEYSKYQNSMQIYNEYYGNFVRWFGRNYEPAQWHDERRLPWELPEGDENA